MVACPAMAVSLASRDEAEPARTQRDVTGKGTRVRYAEAGDGPVLVLVHDALSSALEWDDVMTALARRFRVVAVDLPGHGESEKPAPERFAYGFDAFADSLVDVVSTLGAARVHVCGRSLGALVALTLAAKHPALVDRLVLVAPGAYRARPSLLSRAGSWPVVGRVFYKQIVGKGLFRRHFVEQLADPASVSPLRVDAQFEHFDEPASREAAHATLLAMQDTRPVVARLGRVGAPTLVACGRSDRFVPVADGRRLARDLPRARFEVFECGHSPAEENPDAFVQVLAGFLSGKVPA